MNHEKLVLFLLRLSIASVFLYAAIASIIEPQNWIGFLPQILRNLFPPTPLLLAFSIYELLLGIWILLPWQTFYAAVLSVATLLGIVVTNIGVIDIVFRDFAIICAAVALATAYFPQKK